VVGSRRYEKQAQEEQANPVVYFTWKIKQLTVQMIAQSLPDKRSIAIDSKWYQCQQILSHATL